RECRPDFRRRQSRALRGHGSGGLRGRYQRHLGVESLVLRWRILLVRVGYLASRLETFKLMIRWRPELGPKAPGRGWGFWPLPRGVERTLRPGRAGVA